MHPRKLIRESALFAIAQYLMRLGLMLRGIIAARWLGPELYGAWNALQLIMDYGGNSHLGTYQGIDQLAPGRIVDGDPARLRRLKRAAIFNGIALSVVFGIGVVLYLLRGEASGKILEFWGMGGVLVALVIVLLTSIAFVHLSLLRAHDRIPVVSGFFLLQGAIGVVLGLSLIPSLGLWGLLWGWLTGTLAGILFVRLRAPGLVPLLPVPSRAGLQLLRTGLPMFVFTASRFVMRTLDRVVILRFLGTLELGYYSLTMMALTLLMYLPDSVAYVLYPQLLRQFRASGGDPASIRDRLDRATVALSLLLPLLCGVGFLAAPVVVEWILPKFLPGAPVVRVVVFGAPGLALAGISAIALMTLEKRLWLIPTSIAITALTAWLDYYAVQSGYGIMGVAWVTLSVYLLNGVVLFLLAMSNFRRSLGATFLYLGRCLLPLAIAVVLAVGLDRLLPHEPVGWSAFFRLVALIAAFKILYLLAIRPLARGLGLRQLLSEFRLPGLSGGRRNGDSEG